LGGAGNQRLAEHFIPLFHSHPPLSPKKAKIAETIVPLSCEIRDFCRNSGNHTSALLQNVELNIANLRRPLRLNKQITVFCSLYLQQNGKANVNKGGLYLLFPIEWLSQHHLAKIEAKNRSYFLAHAGSRQNRRYKPLLFGRSSFVLSTPPHYPG
jgi:hypothetical protein